MVYELIPASTGDKGWLEQLRRDVYQELFEATFGGWDEVRHVRQFAACWERGHISIITIDGVRVGMVQLFQDPHALQVGELQIHSSYQSRGIGSQILRDTIAQAQKQRKNVILSVGLKNDRALQLYQRLGFQEVAQTETHYHMVLDFAS